MFNIIAMMIHKLQHKDNNIYNSKTYIILK